MSDKSLTISDYKIMSDMLNENPVSDFVSTTNVVKKEASSNVRAIKVAYTTDASGYIYMTTDQTIKPGDVVVCPVGSDDIGVFNERGYDKIRVAKVVEVDVQYYMDFNDPLVEYVWIFCKLDITITENPLDQERIAHKGEINLKLK